MSEQLPVLALHGWLGRGDDWAVVADALGDTAVIAPDLPGHGDFATSDADFSMDGAATSALRALDSSGAERAVVGGYSMGGRVALHLALSHPSRVAGLVLVSASAGLQAQLERDSRRVIDSDRARMLLADPEAFVVSWYAAPLFDPMPAPARAALAADRLAHGSPEGWARALTGMSVGVQPWFGDRLHEIRVPVAVLAGAVDAKFTTLAHEMAAIGDSETTIVAGAGHALLVERPDVVARAIARLVGVP
jgi:2-succinyl-6-hydroxy-2,4-cyclohexadiene-1-carboxylate synthase